jgi:hypothetical protein
VDRILPLDPAFSATLGPEFRMRDERLALSYRS